jgi:membrane-associated protein
VPIIRTFAPFVAGVGRMNYLRFLSYNVVGGIAWVAIFLFGGFFFGNIPVIKNNLAVVIILVIVASVIPGVMAFLKERTTKVPR